MFFNDFNSMFNLGSRWRFRRPGPAPQAVAVAPADGPVRSVSIASVASLSSRSPSRRQRRCLAINAFFFPEAFVSAICAKERWLFSC